MNPRNAFAFAVAILLTSFAHAAQPALNFSDHWWSESDPGWGVGVSQQDNVMFVTFLVHDAGGRSIWYSGTLTLSADPLAPVPVYDGDVFATTGPWFASPPDSGSVTNRKAGTAKFTGTSANAATLAFTLDGVSVSKQITRLTLRSESIAGAYLGAITLFGSCGSNVIFAQQSPTHIGIVQNGATVAIRAEDYGTGQGCTYTGSYVQHGQLGEVTGSYACDTKESGTFRISELRSAVTGLLGRFETKYKSVQFQPGVDCEGSGAVSGAYVGPVKQ